MPSAARRNESPSSSTESLASRNQMLLSVLSNTWEGLQDKEIGSNPGSLYGSTSPESQTWKAWCSNYFERISFRPNLRINKDQPLQRQRQTVNMLASRHAIVNRRLVRNVCQTAAAVAEASEERSLEIEYLEAIAKVRPISGVSLRCL